MYTVPKITQEQIKELLSYNPETGVFIWLKTLGRARLGYEAGSIQPNGYRYIMVDGHLNLSHRLAWLYMTGVFPVDFIDHIDGNKSNNKLENLRACTNAENMKNQGVRKSNTSGFKGVSWHKRDKKWVAHARVNKKLKFLGSFDSPEHAAIAYENYAKENHGEFYKEATIDKLLKD